MQSSIGSGLRRVLICCCCGLRLKGLVFVGDARAIRILKPNPAGACGEAQARERFFNRPSIYGFADDALRFCFFSKAALEYMLKAGKRPQVIHCHDWPTGLVPVLLFEIYKFHGMANQRSCYTIHNFRHQGLVGAEVLRASGLNRPEYYLAPDRMRDNLHSGALNLMKGGIVYANCVTTVSRHYAWEVMNTEQGFGLGPTLYAHRRKFGGVRNGVDYAVWNPEVDALIPYRYGANDLEGKYRDKEALRERLGLRQGGRPGGRRRRISAGRPTRQPFPGIPQPTGTRCAASGDGAWARPLFALQRGP